MWPPSRLTAIALLLTAFLSSGCESPPRMWAKRLYQAANERPPVVPREKFEKASDDAAAAEAFARLCGVDTKPMDSALRSFLNHRDVLRPDILWDSYRLRSDRLFTENRLATFYPGECWQRGQDFNDVLAAIRAGEFPRYERVDIWQ